MAIACQQAARPIVFQSQQDTLLSNFTNAITRNNLFTFKIVA
jgi:hypothetical protein